MNSRSTKKWFFGEFFYSTFNMPTKLSLKNKADKAVFENGFDYRHLVSCSTTIINFKGEFYKNYHGGTIKGQWLVYSNGKRKKNRCSREKNSTAAYIKYWLPRARLTLNSLFSTFLLTYAVHCTDSWTDDFFRRPVKRHYPFVPSRNKIPPSANVLRCRYWGGKHQTELVKQSVRSTPPEPPLWRYEKWIGHG